MEMHLKTDPVLFWTGKIQLGLAKFQTFLVDLEAQLATSTQGLYSVLNVAAVPTNGPQMKAPKTAPL